MFVRIIRYKQIHKTMKYHNNLNPKQIRVLKLNEQSTNVIGFDFIPFNLIDWIHPSLKKYFNDDELLQACYDLDLTFDDLTHYGGNSGNICVSLTSNQKISIPIIYQVSDYKSNKKGTRRGYSYSTDSWSCKVPYDGCNGEIVLNILQKRYQFLNKRCYNDVEVINFNLKEFNTGSTKPMVDLPKELHSLTVEQLLNLDSISFERQKSKFSIYTNFESFYFKPEKNIDNDYYPYISIDINSFINGDWKAIEDKTRNYFTNYFSGGWHNVEERFPYVKNRMSWIDELFTLPEILELKADILSNTPLTLVDILSTLK